MPLFEENRRQKALTLVALCFALFMAMLDNTVVNVALPTLARTLHTGVSGLQWIVDGYVLAFASLLLTGGIIGDRYGRKRTFLAGLALFTFSSLLCGLAGSASQLIAARALQGVGAALLLPGTLSIITVTFPPAERAKAIGIWAGMSGMALALGPTLGGWMVQSIGWESVFFLNVPIGVLGFIVATKVITESRAPHARKLDVTGLVLGTAGLFAVTFGLIEANDRGWADPLIVTLLASAALLLATFVAWEKRNPDAMMPLSYFRIPAFSAGNTVAFAVSLGMFGTFFFMSLYMQQIRDYSPLQAGVRFLPMTGMIIFTAPLAGRIASRRGSRGPMVLGLTLAGTGLLLLSRISAGTPWSYVIPVMMAMGIGMGMTMTPMTAAVMNAVGHTRAGLGSAMTNTSREVGGVFGIALLGTLLTTTLKAALRPKLAALGVGGATQAAIVEAAGHAGSPQALGTLPPQLRLGIQQAVRDSFLTGFHRATIVGAAVLLAAAVVSWRWIPSGAPHTEDITALLAGAQPAQ